MLHTTCLPHALRLLFAAVFIDLIPPSPPFSPFSNVTHCREAAQLTRSLAELHGGLPALLAATSREVPAAAAHMTPSAAAIASALFVAANEFTPDAEMESALAAEQLLLGGLGRE